MPSTRRGSIHLFKFAGVDVFLHWSWFVFALVAMKMHVGSYSSGVWNAAEYLSLFFIVLMHEYGHALACRQVGGFANRIVLWPLGGVAYVDPPPRPGAVLWSLAAGPLVNVALIPVLLVLARTLRAVAPTSNLHELLKAVFIINVVLLAFNLLPIYPLDGGQMLRALLWFLIGRARSLMAATVVGFLGVLGILVVAVRDSSIWFMVLSAFILMNCWGGMKHAVMLLRAAKVPRHQGFACPWCKAAPPVGAFWRCGQCKTPLDTFQANAVCPHCSARFDVTRCIDCGRRFPMNEWVTSAPATRAVADLA